MSLYKKKHKLFSGVLGDMNKSDKQLVADFIIRGDNNAFELIVEHYLNPLFNFVYQMTGDTAASEDIVQEVFVKVWKNISSFDQEKKFSTWIFAIAKNAAFDWLKKKKAFSFSKFENEDGSNSLDYIEDGSVLYASELFQKIDNEKEVKILLDSLAPEHKMILLLNHKYGFSLIEIAEIMGHPSNTVKSKYHRTIIQLRKKYFSNSPSIQGV
jgi:RNA polymerase sigma-70 factor (ECF subfamily)